MLDFVWLNDFLLFSSFGKNSQIISLKFFCFISFSFWNLLCLKWQCSKSTYRLKMSCWFKYKVCWNVLGVHLEKCAFGKLLLGNTTFKNVHSVWFYKKAASESLQLNQTVPTIYSEWCMTWSSTSSSSSSFST